MTKQNSSDKNQAPGIQAMVWYKAEDWDRLMGLFSDSHLLPPNYADWLGRAEEMVQQVEKTGDVVVKVFIDPETFPAWCKAQGREMNSDARAELAIQVVQEQNFSP